MAICFHGNGIIKLSDVSTDIFKDRLIELIKEYDRFCEIDYEEEYKVLEFKNYARHYFMDDIKKLISENKSCIHSGKLYFTCYDEDPFDADGFPFHFYIEIDGGEIFEQKLMTKLPSYWEFYIRPDKKEDKDNDKVEKSSFDKFLDKIVTDNNSNKVNKNNGSDDLPF